MESSSFDKWVSMFNPKESDKVWRTQPKELRGASMLLYNFKQELYRVECDLIEEINYVKGMLKEKKLYKEKLENHLKNASQSRFRPKNSEKTPQKPSSSKIKPPKYLDSLSELPTRPSDSPRHKERKAVSSPTLTQRRSKLDSKTEINTLDRVHKLPPCKIKSPPSDTSTSPTISKFKTIQEWKRMKERDKIHLSEGESSTKRKIVISTIEGKKKPALKRLAQKISDDIIDCSVIESTPKSKKKSSSLPKNLNKASATNKSTSKELTLTQMLEKLRKKNRPDSPRSDSTLMDLDDVYFDEESMSTSKRKKIEGNIFKENESSISDSESELPGKGDYLEDVTNLQEDHKISRLQSENTKQKFSKILTPGFVQNYDRIPEVPEKEGPDYVHKPDTVRGQERQQLPGWSCKDCAMFYEGMDLPLEEIEKKMKECSRHRNQFKPDDETPPGFWDLTMGPTPEGYKTPPQQTEKSTVFHFYQPDSSDICDNVGDIS